jgi:hypothetical protein
MEEKILTLHPQGKRGVNISMQKYDVMKTAIIETLTEFEALTFTELTQKISEKLTEGFDGNIAWYVITVKLDLEARKILEGIPGQDLKKSD